MLFRTSLLTAAIAIFGLLDSASAQSSGLFGSNGVNSRSGTSAAGLSGSGYGAQTGAGGGVTGFTGNTASSATGFVASGGSEFVGRGNTGFTGNRLSSNSTTGGTSSVGGMGGTGGGATGRTGTTGSTFGRGGGSTNFARSGQNFGQNNFGGNGFGQGAFGNGSNVNQQTIRPQPRIAFTHQPRNATQVQTAVSGQLSNAAALNVSNLNVTHDGAGQLTLRGSVASEDARRLAAAMARLEPGVRSVKNELVVQKP